MRKLLITAVFLPLVAAAQNAVQFEFTKAPVVIPVGKIHSGVRSNIIPEDFSFYDDKALPAQEQQFPAPAAYPGHPAGGKNRNIAFL